MVEISWYYIGGPTPPNCFSTKVGQFCHWLEITDVQKSNEGTYSCNRKGEPSDYSDDEIITEYNEGYLHVQGIVCPICSNVLNIG